MKVEITDKGIKEHDRVADERTRYVAEMMATLDPESLEQLKAATPALAELARTYNTGNLH